MKFILNLTLRELRSTWRRLLFFFLCISIGVGSVVGLRSLIQNLNKAVSGDARELLTADFEISSTNVFSPSELSIIDSIISKTSIIEARTETITTTAMARTNTGFQLIELKGVQENFPLVGRFVLSDGNPFDYELLKNRGAIVHSSLLEKLNLKVGDSVFIGTTEFQIRGTFYEEPGGSGGFQLGPRVFIEKRSFDEAGLASARARRRILFRTSEDPTPLVQELRRALKGTILNVTSYKESQENIDNQFQRLEDYLSLTGLLILVLGGIGIWNVARAFVEQKRKTIAVLKCLGAENRLILSTYVLQILTLSLIGCGFGILLAQVALLIAKIHFSAVLPERLSATLQPSAILHGLILGLSISLIFSILPLLQIRNIHPNLLLRDENSTLVGKLDKVRLSLAGSLIILLSLIAIWQAGSVVVGIVFLVGLIATTLILYLAATILTTSIRKTKNLVSFAVSQAINSLYRPGNQTRIIIMAVGLGIFIILSVQSLEANLLREFNLFRNSSLPSVFLIDIQRSQIDEIRKIVDEIAEEPQLPIPTVRARIVSVNGEPIDFQNPEIRQQQGQIGREFAVTYRDRLDENESIIEGQWWQGSSETQPEVSVEEQMSKRLNVGIGDTITFDILGRKIEATIKNIRKINLRNTRTAFVFVFRPGVLEKAPQTFILPVNKQLSADKRELLQRRVLTKFPNVQVFDTADILQSIRKLTDNFTLAISFVGGFVILTGILILIGSITLTRSQRIYENAILKTLGADRSTLAKILVTEYVILGTLASMLGALLSIILSYVVTTKLFKIDWEANLTIVLLGIFATIFIVILCGFITCFELIFKKPLAVLRTQ